jgi:hypothetical protein
MTGASEVSLALNGKTVLFAWELGEGLGHLPALKAIAIAAKAEGATPVFALRDTVLTQAALRDVGAQILQAPFWATPVTPDAPSGSYADIMVANGFASVENARALIGGWSRLIDAVKPDLVVCEHAPGAAVAAFGRIPVAMVGNGFVVPPADGDVFPSFEAGRSDPARQTALLPVLQQALADSGRRAPATLCEPFRGAFRGVYSFPALDTYRRVRREAVLGPIEPVPPLLPLPSKRRVFVYSAADLAMIAELTQAVMDLGPEASVYFRGTLGARGAVIKSRGVTVHDTAPALPTVLAGASVVFSHGGSGFSSAALAAGRPHVVYPRHFEAQSTARALEELGVGITLSPFDAKRFGAAVTRAHDDHAMREAAQAAGADAQAFVAQAAPLETTMAALRRLPL